MKGYQHMRVLGIETSCDETGIAVYDEKLGLLAHAIDSQIDIHAQFGGVVPELASRDHIRKVTPLIETVLKKANLAIHDIHGIAYTKGPGLAGALLVGAMIGRTLGFVLNVPTIGVHHLEGHLLAPFLTQQHSPSFPFLGLIISGGHTELVIVHAIGKYNIIGETLDDAVGEAFDKTAKLLGLGYPGGAALAKLAEEGHPRFHFPRPMTEQPGLDFSFSGLKTFALHTSQSHELTQQTKADIARAFQDAVVETVVIKCRRALKQTGLQQIVIAGGVSANLALRHALTEVCQMLKVSLYFPELEFCSDNGAMIAYAGLQHLLLGQREALAVSVHPRWRLEDVN